MLTRLAAYRDPAIPRHVRRARRAVLAASVAMAAACSDSGTQPGPAPVPGPVPDGEVATITITPSSLALEMGAAGTLAAVARDAAGQPVAGDITWETSSAGVASVDSAGRVTAVAAGAAAITASYGAVHSEAVAVTVTTAAAWPTTGPTSEALIADAVASGALSADKGLVYRALAAYGDVQLPTQFRGAPDNTLDNPVLMLLAERFSLLSAEDQALVRPFFLNPGTEGSWYTSRYRAIMAAAGVEASGNVALARRVRAASPLTWSTPAECVAALESVGMNKTITTEHFSIHYLTWPGKGPDLDSEAARLVAEIAEDVWAKETATFARTPLSDASIQDSPDLGAFANGCDGKVDIWIIYYAMFALHYQVRGLTGMTIPYLGNVCGKSPAKIELQGVDDAMQLRNILAHEFFHVLQMGSYSQPHCPGEYVWLGEATGNWAMDLVYPDDQYEQGWASNYPTSERLSPIDEAGVHADSPYQNGYSDYPFLFYLAHQYDNSAVKAIWDATEQGDAVQAIVAAAATHGGIKQVWPEFALALWNDYAAAKQDSFYTWDKLKWGLKESFDRPLATNPSGVPPDTVALHGASRKTFELLSSAIVFPDGHEIPRLSIYADYLIFDDPAVASVLYVNALAAMPQLNLKIQAMVKQGGAWKAAEDWTGLDHKSWCRDLKDERIEELVLIYSNSDGDRPSAPISVPVPPTVSVSNVGCARWEGEASVETVIPGDVGGTSKASATGVVLQLEELPVEQAGMLVFTSGGAGTVTGSSTTLCTSATVSGPVHDGDARLEVNLDNLVIGDIGPPPDRAILQGTGATTIPTTDVFTCTDPPTSHTSDRKWDWLQIPVPGYSVSADGRTIEGTVVETAPPGAPPFTRTITWHFSAVREP